MTRLSRTLVLTTIVVVAAIAVPTTLAVNVHVRVEGRTQTIFGPTEPMVDVPANALDALETTAVLGEFYLHVTSTSFGPYVDQIGLFPASASSGWVFKLDNASGQVGADQTTLKDGDTLLWYWADFDPTTFAGPKTLVLKRTKANCYAASPRRRQGDADARRGRDAPRRLEADGLDERRRRLRRARTGAARPGDAHGRGPVERARVSMRLLAPLAAAAALCAAGCGSGAGARSKDATLWVTHDRGRVVIYRAAVRSGRTAAQALEGVAKVKTRYSGEFIQGIDGVEGGGSKDWFYYVNGYAAGVGGDGLPAACGRRRVVGLPPLERPGRGAARRRRVPGAVRPRLRRQAARRGGALRRRDAGHGAAARPGRGRAARRAAHRRRAGRRERPRGGRRADKAGDPLSRGPRLGGRSGRGGRGRGGGARARAGPARYARRYAVP